MITDEGGEAAGVSAPMGQTHMEAKTRPSNCHLIKITIAHGVAKSQT